VTTNRNAIIKKLVHHCNLSAREFSLLCEPHFSRSKARGMLAAESNRRFYRAKPGDVYKVVKCLIEFEATEDEVITHSQEIFHMLDADNAGEPCGKKELRAAFENVFGNRQEEQS